MKDRRNLYVLSVEEPGCLTESMSFMFEMSFVEGNRICKKITTSNGEIYYVDLENGKKYYLTDEFGSYRVEEGTMVPITDYYNFLGMLKKNNYENKDVVNNKVKKLRKMKKI